MAEGHGGVSQACDSVDTHARMKKINVKGLHGTKLRIPPLLLPFSLHHIPNLCLGVWTDTLSPTMRRHAEGRENLKKGPYPQMGVVS